MLRGLATALILTLAIALVGAAAFAAPQRVDRPVVVESSSLLGPNDTCATAFELTGAFDFDTETCDDANDYDPLSGGCTGYSAGGPDEVYRICLPPGGTIDLTFEELQYDASIYLVTDCADPAGTCVAGDDCYPWPCTDFINYTNPNPTNTTYYLIVDGFGTACGLAHLSGMTDVCDVTPVEPTTWGKIKGSYK